MTGRRILLLAPHPDDEAVGCAASIRRARDRGATVYALYLTTGVPAVDRLWPWQRRGYEARVARRRREAEAAAALLGIEPSGFHARPSRTLRTHLDAARAEIERAIGRHGIDMLWTPAWEGAHQDHDAANLLAATFRDRVAVWEFAEYNFAGGVIRSQTFIGEHGGEEILRLDPAAATSKRAVLALYLSERGNIGHIRLEQESLRPLPAHDYSRPPHPGRLFWERFQWVPFRHPRVDFEPAAAVYPALAAWAKQQSLVADMPLRSVTSKAATPE